jgi:thiamine biosynthesis lipoprotein
MRELWQSHYKKAHTVLAVVAFLWLFANQRRAFTPEVVQELSGQAMGTAWHVQVVHAADDKLTRTGADLGKALARLDQGIFSSSAADSELSKLNATPVGKALTVSRELLEVLLLSSTINRQSYGTFDITVAPLLNLWGFGSQPAAGVPGDAAIAAAMKRLGADKYDIDARSSTVTRTADITIDLSAIAKGYAVDKVAELLQAAGYRNFRVEMGGAVRVQGWREPETGWVVTIESPYDGPAPRTAVAHLDNHGAVIGVAGAGDNRSHAIDPHTGRPIAHALMAVTVLANTVAEADAWSSAMLVLGPEAGPLLAEKREMAVYFIIRKAEGFETRHTPGFEPYLKTEEGSGNGQAQL